MFDVLYHVFPDDGFAVSLAKMLDRASHDFGIFTRPCMPFATGDESSTFKESH